jgi:hypothetical protein
MTDLDTSPFVFDFPEVGSGCWPVSLDNTERATLRELAQPGGSLWKIMQGMVDYRRELESQFILMDLYSPAGVEEARKVHQAVKSIDWQLTMWEGILTFTAPMQGIEQ